MVALQNFFLVLVLPIATGTGIILLFRWWLKRSTGYDPIGDKGQIHPKEIDSREDSYAPYQPPKWREDKAKDKDNQNE